MADSTVTSQLFCCGQTLSVGSEVDLWVEMEVDCEGIQQQHNPARIAVAVGTGQSAS